MIDLIVILPNRCCRSGVTDAVHTRVFQTSISSRLLIQTEERGCPSTETMGLFEHGKRELLQGRCTNEHVFHDSSGLFTMYHSEPKWCNTPPLYFLTRTLITPNALLLNSSYSSVGISLNRQPIWRVGA